MTTKSRHIATALAAALMMALIPATAQAAGAACVVDAGAHGQGLIPVAQQGAGGAVSYVEAADASFDALAAGVRTCSGQGAAVISVSWAGGAYTAEWAAAIADADARGALVLLAAGNPDIAAKCGHTTCASATVPGGLSVTNQEGLPGAVRVDTSLLSYGGSSAATAYAAGVAARTGARDAVSLQGAVDQLQAAAADGEDVAADDGAAVQGTAEREGAVPRAASVRKLRFTARKVGRRVVVRVTGVRAGQRLVVQVGRDRYEGSRARVSVSRARLPRTVKAMVVAGSRTVKSVRLTVRR